MILFSIVLVAGLYFIIRYDMIVSGKTSFVILFVILAAMLSLYKNGDIDINQYTLTGIILFGGILLLRLVYLFFKDFYRDDKSYKIDTIFPERKQDLQRIMYYIKRENIVGIDAPWGAGKTYLLDALAIEESMKSEYDIIKLDVLTCNTKQLIPVLFYDLDNILKKNGILSLQSNFIKTMFEGEKNIRTLINLFFDPSQGYTKQLDIFKKQLLKTDKKIMIIYEDLDRIDDQPIIKEIFSISEKLSDPHIKIIYQYSQKHLKELGFAREYMAKFVPHILRLTEMKFDNLITYLLPELKPINVKLSLRDFDDLKRQLNSVFNGDWNSKSQEPEPVLSRETIIVCTPRNVKFFLEEILLFLEYYPEYNIDFNRNCLIRYMYLKHMIPDSYNTLTDVLAGTNSILQALKYKTSDGRSLLLQELRDQHISENTVFTNEDDEIKKENRKNYVILKFLEYKQYIDSSETDNNKDKIKIQIDEYNMKLDRRYKHLFTAGNRMETTTEEFGAALHNILSEEDLQKRISMWNTLVGGRKNQSSIPYVLRRSSNFHGAMEILVAWPISVEEEIRFLELFFTLRDKPEYFDEEYIDVIHLSRLDNVKVFDYIMEKTSKLDVKDNFYAYDGFIDFINTFSNALYIQGYTDIAPKGWKSQKYFSDHLTQDGMYTTTDTFDGQKDKILIFLQETIENIQFLEDELKQYSGQNDDNMSYHACRNVKEVCKIINQSLNSDKNATSGASFVPFSSVKDFISQFNKEKEDYKSKLIQLFKDNKHEFWREAEKLRCEGKISWRDICDIIKQNEG